jgi:hypothetical protein
MMTFSPLRRPGARRRWAVAGGFAALVCVVPAVVAARPVDVRRLPVGVLLGRVRASVSVPFQGYAQASGHLDLPDVDQFADEVNLLSDTSRLRIWYSGTDHYRVDTISAVGEKDVYQDGTTGWVWDSGRRTAVRSTGEPAVPLPQAPDVTPPALGRRLLAEARPAQVREAGARRIAGRDSLGLVVAPADPRTLVGTVTVWVDPGSGLPLEVDVTAVGGHAPAFRAGFLDLSMGRPPAGVLTFDPYRDRDARVSDDNQNSAPRLPFGLPEQIAGLRRRDNSPGAARSDVTTYGDGYALVAVVPVDGGTARAVRGRLDAPSRPPVTGAYGEGSLITSPLLTGLVVGAGRRGWLLTGSVPPSVLESMATELVHDRPRRPA